MKLHGIIGIILILFVQINFILKIEPFATWYFPIVWFGFIFLIDALVYKLKNESLIISTPKKFVFLLFLSFFIWVLFEYVNIALGNWNYHGGSLGSLKFLFVFLSFSTVIPAIFETGDLLHAFNLFEKRKLHKKHNISTLLIYSLIAIGLIGLLLAIALPTYFFPLIWGAFFFILDPVNYMNKQPSMIQHLKDRKLVIPLTIAFGTLICGFLWEFWNYWAVIKWTYSIPFFNFLKIFEMPLVGYIGYPFFGFEIFAFYHFSKPYFKKLERKLYLK